MAARLTVRRIARNAAAALLVVSASPALAAPMSLREGDARLATVGWRLQTANVALCPRTALLHGLTIESASQFPLAFREEARMDPRPSIAAVARGSAAERAGLRAGDILETVDARALPLAQGSAVSATPVLETEAVLAAALADAPATVAFVREGVRQHASLGADRGCAARLQLVSGGFQATRTDGLTVQLSDRMLAFAAGDDALAAVVAHELAHVALDHARRKTPSRTAEFEADWLSVWLVARAGYDLDALVPFWTRLGRRTDAGIFADGTHPGWRKRAARLAQAIALVRAQQAAGAPLVPPSQQQSASQVGNRR